MMPTGYIPKVDFKIPAPPPLDPSGKATNGGPAFPAQFYDERATGMSLRDYFAGLAMQGWANSTMVGEPARGAAWAYRMADAMLEARK